MSFQHSEHLKCHMRKLYGMASLHRFLQHPTVSICYVCLHECVLCIFKHVVVTHSLQCVVSKLVNRLIKP